MVNDEYEYIKEKLMSRKTYPYYFHYEALAKEFYDRFKVEFPSALYFSCEDFGQVVCYDDIARKHFFYDLLVLANKHKKAIERISKIVSE